MTVDSPFKDLRTQIRDALKAADINAYSAPNDKAIPPLVYVSPREPYLTREGATFGGWVGQLQVTCVARQGINEQRADDLDDLIVTVLDVLEAEGFAEVGLYVQQVNRPGQVSIGGTPYLAVAIDVAAEIQRRPPAT